MADADRRVLVEVIADSVASAIAAERGGAGRIELCSGLSDGGITPSAGLIQTARAAVALPIHVMIRPRGGDFLYDAAEFDAMRRDVRLAKQLGANGAVFGLLDMNGNIDVARTRELVELARPLAVTFHRAFDMSADLIRALEDLCAAGVERVLTSGGESDSLLGCATIAQLVRQAVGRIVVMPGGGIRPENALGLVNRTGVREIHAGLRSSVPSGMRYRNPRISMEPGGGGEYQRTVLLESEVRRLTSVFAVGSGLML